MSQPILVVIIVLALVAAVALVIRSHKGALSSVAADLKAHVSQVSAGAETRLVRLITRTPTTATPAKAIPVVGTTAEPAPAAPAPTEAVAPPPVTVAPAAPPAAPAPVAAGSGTEPSLTIEPRAPIPDSTGPVPVTSLSLADLRFLWWATINPATPKMHNWEYTVLSGTRVQIQEDLATAGLNLSWLRAFQPDAYHGILRNYYDAALKA